MFIELDNTFLKALRSGVNLFLGSGFPLLATNNKDRRPFPIGNALKDELITHFRLEHLCALGLAQLCAVIDSSRRDDLRSFLNDRFDVGQWDKRYASLERIRINAIFTTNIDNLIYKVYEKSLSYYINDILCRGPVLHDRMVIDYIPLHGTVFNENTPLTFSTVDIARAFQSDPDRWHFLTAHLQKSPTLFWGYSLNDAGVLQALSPETVKDREHKDKWIMVYEDDDATKTYFRALGFNIIVSDTPQMLDYIGSLAPTEPRIARPSKQHTPDLFPTHGIPSIGTVPAVPLLDFYLGGPPTWYNVFTGSIYKTGHYHEIIDKINAESDLIVIGLPASSKTTLLMQVAANVPYHGHKLIYQSPSADQVRLVLNRLDGEHALVFVDDCCDDAEAFSLLLGARNVQVVGFDRDYNYDIVSHFFQGGSYNLHNVTELSDIDVQEIFARLPGGVRRSTYKRPRTAPGINPSLFEIIESNLNKPTLKERFRAVLKRLKSHDIRLHDMLVMVSYVHSCRTPVSFDMLCAYFRNVIENYSDIYKLLERIRPYVVPHTGFVDDSQDYFTPRSTIIAEAITDLSPTTDFKRVLQGFHQNVSTTRIARYYVFKRRAYDQRIVSKAFEDWQEGKKFYEFVFGKDPSPFMLQRMFP